MGLIELFFIAVGLSMDAFAVSICKGLACWEQNLRHNLLAGLYFGGFQGLMPAIGWLLGVRFSAAITSIDHWIAFVLRCFIGGSMIRESRSEEDEEEMDASFRPKEMLTMAVATSIDALAVGISFAILDVNIWWAAGIIGVVSFVLSFIGGMLGKGLGNFLQAKAEFAGGAVLIIIGIKILVEHIFLGG